MFSPFLYAFYDESLWYTTHAHSRQIVDDLIEEIDFFEDLGRVRLQIMKMHLPLVFRF